MHIYQSDNELRQSIILIEKIISKNNRFSQSIFKMTPNFEAFFDYSFVTSEILFDFLVGLCCGGYAKYFNMIVTKPDPIKYYYKTFNFIPAVKFGPNDNYTAFGKFLTDVPASSPADAILYRSDEVIIFSDNLDIIIFADRRFEIANIVVLKVDTTAVKLGLFSNIEHIFLNPEDAYNHMSSFRNLPIRRDEFRPDPGKG